MPGKPTMSDVAREAGVSVMTVSYTYNQPDRVAAGTREKVAEAAARLGYPGPDAAAELEDEPAAGVASGVGVAAGVGVGVASGEGEGSGEGVASGVGVAVVGVVAVVDAGVASGVGVASGSAVGSGVMCSMSAPSTSGARELKSSEEPPWYTSGSVSRLSGGAAPRALRTRTMWLR